MRIFQKGFNFGQDGPGNRLVYHLQGCNMKCIWCSNPEGMSLCGGYDISTEDLLAEAISAKPMFFSGGGVTFTGGEATMQFEELKKVLMLLKENGIHTAIETNGTSPRLGELLPFVDYLIMDFKHHHSPTLQKYTGVGNELVKRNFEANCKAGRQQHIRIPLIKGINADMPEGFAEYFMSCDTSKTLFEFLPYHEYGKGKWQSEYLVKDGFVPKETLEEFKNAFKANGLNIVET